MLTFNPEAPSMMAMIATSLIVLIAAWHDWRHWRIPNALIAGGMSAALMLALFSQGGIGLRACLAGGILGLLILLPFYLARGMGAGDVKLLATVGMLTGPDWVVLVALTTFLVGGVWGLALLAPGAGVWSASLAARWPKQRWLLQRHPPPQMTHGSRGTIPYGVVIAIGTLMSIYLMR